MLLLFLLIQEPFVQRQGDKTELLAEGGGGEATEAAVGRALGWLARHQNEDGSWSARSYLARCGHVDECAPTGLHRSSEDERFSVGITGLAVLSFLGTGITHESKEHGDVVRHGLDLLIRAQDVDGCVGSRDVDQYMYNHAIAALCLAEAYGMTRNLKVKSAAQKSVDFLMAAQNPGKGWRYIAEAGENDTSVTGWAVMALRSARYAGLDFDRSVAFDGARAWFDQAAYRSGDHWKAGYQFGAEADVYIPGINDQFDQHPTMTAIAVVSRLAMDHDRKNEKVRGGIAVLLEDTPKWDGNAIDFYYWYWATQAMHEFDGARGGRVIMPDAAEKAAALVADLASEEYAVREAAVERLEALGDGALPVIEKACASADPEVAARAKQVQNAIIERSPHAAGPRWRAWNGPLVKALVDHQNTEGGKQGSWEPVGRWCCKGGRVAATAMNALTLEAYYRYRPNPRTE